MSRLAWTQGVDEGDASAVVARAVEHFERRILIAASFSREDVLLIALAAQVDPKVRVVALDTGRLPEETFAVADAVRRQLEVEIEWHFPEKDSLEALIRREGPLSFRDTLEARHRCCEVRKVLPFQRAIAGAEAWITGRRRGQALSRSTLELFEDTAGESR